MSQRRPELVLQRKPYGSWLLGPADESPRILRSRVHFLMTFFSLTTNTIGAAVVFVLAVFVLPGPPPDHELQLVRAIALPGYFLLAVVVGAIWSIRYCVRVTGWVLQDRPATRKEQIAVLRLPLRMTLIEVFLWLLATAFFSVLALIYQPDYVLRMLITTFDGGIVTCAISYLLAEFALRPIAR